MPDLTPAIVIPTLPPATMDKLKRLAILLLSAGVIAFNKRLGLGLGPVEIAALSTIVVAYLTGSNWKEAALQKAVMAGQAASAAVIDPAGALAAINKGPQP